MQAWLNTRFKIEKHLICLFEPPQTASGPEPRAEPPRAALRPAEGRSYSLAAVQFGTLAFPLLKLTAFTTGGDTRCDNSLSVWIFLPPPPLSYITNRRRSSPQLVAVMKFYLGQTLGFLSEHVCRRCCCRCSVILGHKTSQRDKICPWMLA